MSIEQDTKSKDKFDYFYQEVLSFNHYYQNREIRIDQLTEMMERAIKKFNDDNKTVK